MPVRTALNRVLRWSALITVALPVPNAWAAGDFPIASCKSWNGTIVERNAIDTPSANMRGIITKADLQYCERDPGGETRAYGGRLTTAECVAKYMREESRAQVFSRANCRTGTITFRYGSHQQSAKFPLGQDADMSCAYAARQPGRGS